MSKTKMRIEEDKMEGYIGVGLVIAGFILGLLSFTGASLGSSNFAWFFGHYASTLHWVIGIIAILLFVTGIFVLIFKSK